MYSTVQYGKVCFMSVVTLMRCVLRNTFEQHSFVIKLLLKFKVLSCLEAVIVLSFHFARWPWRPSIHSLGITALTNINNLCIMNCRFNIRSTQLPFCVIFYLFL